VRLENFRDFSFRELKKLLRKQFGKDIVLLPSSITYVDDEGDKVTIDSTEELAEAFHVASAMSRTLKIFVGDSNKNSTAPDLVEKRKTSDKRDDGAEKEEGLKDRVVHYGFTCDNSGMHPIIGPRYHKIGEDFDLCEEEFLKLSKSEKLRFEKIDEPTRGSWWNKIRMKHRGRCGWRSHRRDGPWGGRRRGGGAPYHGPPPPGCHTDHPRHNVFFRKIKWFLKALRRGDEKPLLSALEATGGAAAEVVEPLRRLIQAIRENDTIDALKRMRRSPAAHAIKRKLREIQASFFDGSKAMFELPAMLLNSTEWAVAIAHLREICPEVARYVERIAGIAPRLALQVPMLLPRLLPLVLKMSFCGKTGAGGCKARKWGKRNAGASKAYAAKFIRDETLPDGAVVAPGKTYTKTWTIENSGSSTWPEACSLLHIGGDLELRASEARVRVGALEPGKSKAVSVNLTTPERNGKYWSYWRLVASDDLRAPQEFDLRVWAEIVVKTDEEEKTNRTSPPMLGTTMIAGGEVETEPKRESDDDLVVVAKPVEDNEDGDGTKVSEDEENDEKDAAEGDEKETAKQTPNEAEEALRAMGFDPATFRELLVHYKGDIEKILNEIFST